MTLAPFLIPFCGGAVTKNKSDAFLLELITGGVESLGQELPPGAAGKYVRLLRELERWNSRMNLTAIRDVEDMVARHFLDSLSVRPMVYGKSMIDLGTGAGFPGLPIAIVEPDLEVVLLDSNARKAGFVQHVIATFDISNAKVVVVRAENYAPERRFDTVIARALGSISRLIELGGHLVAEKGVMLAQKGRYPEDELKDLPEAWNYEVADLSVPGLDTRHIVVLRRMDNDA
jgi:16S rRNA (guanine527-N7)-methyltransferase